MSFTKKSCIAMILGIILGTFLNVTDITEATYGKYVTILFNIVSDLFLSSLKLIIIPLIFFSIVCGIVSLSDDVSISRLLGIKTISLYVLTTVIAISLGLLFSSFIDYEPMLEEGLDNIAYTNTPQSESNIFPNNIFKSLADGNIIHLLFFQYL